jgi:peptidoglycan/xylan/chitin deacetylase (PgdA/CDA1 family)
MANLYKRFLSVLVLVLLLIPVGGFQQIATMESTAIASGSEGNPKEAIQPVEEEDNQSGSNKNTEEREVCPDTDTQNGKTAYLTFDDGPSSLVTPKILEVLRRYDLKATFFVIGEMAEQNPELVRQIHKEGHFIGNHTYSHNYKHIYSNPDNFMAEVTKGEEVLKNILGEDFKTNILRFPGGSFGKKRLPFRERVREKGYLNIDWNVLNGDAEALHVPANVLINRIKETLKNKDNAVILMHDSSTKDTTAEALPEIIDYLQSEGYSFKTLESYALPNSEVKSIINKPSIDN